MFRFGSKKDVNAEFKCTIRLLDDNEVFQCDFNKEQNGQFLLDYCYKNLGLLEKDYFGLRFVDSQKQRNWLDPNRPIHKQVKGLAQIVFCFRVKFYPVDVDSLKEETTRYLLYLQLRRDLQHGRLYCEENDLAYLIAFILQSELGDYDPAEHGQNYAAELNLAPKQENLEKALEQAKKMHQEELQKKTPAEVELLFLKRAITLDTYGIEPQQVKDHKGMQLLIGANYSGILTFAGSRKTHHFKWVEVRKLNYEGRMFIVHLLQNAQKKSYVGFKCATVAACHYLWRCAVEQRYFFTMSSSSDVPQITTGGGFLFRQCKLHYSGRVQREILDDSRNGGLQRSTSIGAPSDLTSRGIARSNTIHLGSTLAAERTTQLTEENPVDESISINHYANTSTRSEPDEGPFNSTQLPVIGRRHCSTLRCQSAANANSTHGTENYSFTTEFNGRPDLTPTEALKSSNTHWNEPTALRASDSPLLPSSPSHRPNPLEEWSDEEEQVGENTDPFSLGKKVTSQRYGDSGIVKQRSDSATRRKLTRQQATTSDANGNASIQNDNKRTTKERVWIIVRNLFFSLLLFIFFLGVSCWCLFEADTPFLNDLRKVEDVKIVKELIYQPTCQWIIGKWQELFNTLDQL